MGGQDKGLVPWQGRPLVEWVLERFSPQVDGLLISANRNQELYRGYGYLVVGDINPGHGGPLAGVLACLNAGPSNWLAVVPCDAPQLPLDLVIRLHQAATQQGANLAYATTPDGAQPTFSLIHQSLRLSLQHYLEQGERKVLGWYNQVGAVPVDFANQPDAFLNINHMP
jgi:molybdopterin-guanine dinucleotide biosynthesis protein A